MWVSLGFRVEVWGEGWGGMGEEDVGFCRASKRIPRR